jgi:hypothetical protein
VVKCGYCERDVVKKSSPPSPSANDLGRTATGGYIWTHEQIVEIAGLIALRDLCMVGEAIRTLYALMGEGRLPAYSEALRNARAPRIIEGVVVTTKGLRGHGPANRTKREKYKNIITESGDDTH